MLLTQERHRKTANRIQGLCFWVTFWVDRHDQAQGVCLCTEDKPRFGITSMSVSISVWDQTLSSDDSGDAAATAQRRSALVYLYETTPQCYQVSFRCNQAFTEGFSHATHNDDENDY